MKFKVLVLLPALLLTLGCSYGSKYSGAMMGGGALSVSQLAPNNVIAGSGAFTLTVSGSGFTSNSVVYWNTVPHTTVMLSTNQISTVISDADIANPGMVSVYVRANNQNSNAVTFNVD